MNTEACQCEIAIFGICFNILQQKLLGMDEAKKKKTSGKKRTNKALVAKILINGEFREGVWSSMFCCPYFCIRLKILMTQKIFFHLAD